MGVFPIRLVMSPDTPSAGWLGPGGVWGAGVC